jgi:hypothetical protein
MRTAATATATNTRHRHCRRDDHDDQRHLSPEEIDNVSNGGSQQRWT